MAGAGAKLFASGDVLTADQVNTYLMDQTIMKFASTSARDAAFGGTGEPSLSEGMFAYTTDTNTLWLYTGATDGWVNVLGSDIGQQALSNRNVIINGAMQVAQRGTSTASITSTGYFTTDRYALGIITLGTWTQSTENDAPTGSGFRKSTKVLCTTADASPAAGDLIYFQQSIEGQNLQQFAKGTSAAKQFSLSFWVKSNVTGTYIAELYDVDNTRSVSATYSVSASATWEKKTITFPADTTGAFDNDNGSSLQLNLWLGAGSGYSGGTLATTWASVTAANRAAGQTNLASAINNYWQITGVQLEAGAVATPFEFEDYGVTLDKCQRYYQKSYNLADAPGTVTTNGEILWQAASTGGESAPTIMLPVRMRTSSTFVFYSSATGASGKIRNHSTAADVAAVSVNSNGERGWSGVGVSLTAGNIGGYHFTASAEL